MSPAPEPTPAPGPTLAAFIRELRRQGGRVAVAVVLVALAAGAFASQREQQWSASAELTVSPDARVGVFGGEVPGAATTPQEIAALIESSAIALRVADELDIDVHRARSIEAETSEERDDPYITVRASADRPDTAMAIANTASTAAVETRRRAVEGRLAAIVETLQTSVDERVDELNAIDVELTSLQAASPPADPAPPDPRAIELQNAREGVVATIAQLRTRLTQLEIEQAAATAGVTIAHEAAEASESGPPRPLHVAVLAGLVALLLASGIVYVQLTYRSAAADR